jgi:hypothetical protein
MIEQFEQILTDLPVPPELVAAGLACLIVIVLLRRAAVALGRGLAARRARRAAIVHAAPDPEAEDPAQAEAEADLPGTLYPMPLLSHGEAQLLATLEAAARDSGGAYRVMAQLSLNAFLFGCAAGRARRADPVSMRQLAALRVDFLILDAEWRPVLAVDLERGEFSASPIEERTMLALERAGIAHMIVGAEGPSDLQRDELKRHLGVAQGVAAE